VRWREGEMESQWRERERWREGVPIGIGRERERLLIGLRLRKISVNRHNLRGFKL